jgi:hypothetical protein
MSSNSMAVEYIPKLRVRTTSPNTGLIGRSPGEVALLMTSWSGLLRWFASKHELK